MSDTVPEKLSERMREFAVAGMGYDVDVDGFADEVVALEARIEALEQADIAMRRSLLLILCSCEARVRGDIQLTLVPSTHDLGCPYRREMQLVLAALRDEEER